MNDAIPMEGMKVSGDLVRVDVVDASRTEGLLRGFLKALTENRISMSLFIGGEGPEGPQFTCCVAALDEEKVRSLTEPIPDLKACVEFSAPVDLLSVFPHRFNLKALGLSLMALGKAQISFHGFCSSLSALTFITDHTDLEQASAVLQKSFNLDAESSRALY